MSEPIIEISDVDFAYGPRLVLKHIQMVVQSGITLGVIGPNGGGKTTLIRLLLGLQQPTRGSIAIRGLSPKQAVHRGNVIGYLPQSPHVPGNFPINVGQFIRLGLTGKIGLLGTRSSADIQHCDLLMRKFGIKDLAQMPIGSLSGGQLQRAFIARALAARPSILLLDEPTTGIDRAGQDQFVRFLFDLKQSLNLTVVLVSHDLRTIAAACDRLACLNVTLHYHDVPANLPQELAREMFGSDVVELRTPRTREAQHQQ
ncbi:MAG: metal ABC transporter ATP-binding protein [Planctomycetota bacterium]|nr:metal ABC transporter ATP-binding protein [Planctomycetota bacterium]